MKEHLTVRWMEDWMVGWMVLQMGQKREMVVSLWKVPDFLMALGFWMVGRMVHLKGFVTRMVPDFWMAWCWALHSKRDSH